MHNKYLTITLFVLATSILNSCSFEKTHKQYYLNLEVIGEKNNEIVTNLKKISINDGTSKKIKILISSSKISKDVVSYSTDGNISGYNLSISTPVQISTKEETINKVIKSSKYLKNFNKPAVDKENYDRTLSELYNKSIFSIKSILVRLNEN